jgi:hypothetical protein
MIATPKIDDLMTSTCPACNRLVRSQLTLRNVALARTRLVVTDVLVDVCPACDHVISIAPGSVEQLREAGSWK